MMDLILLSVFLCSSVVVYLYKSASAMMIMAIITVFFIFKYLRLKNSEKYYKKKLDSQWADFIEILNNDLKIPAIAQLRGLEILEKSHNDVDREEMLAQIKNSCIYTLEMISMIVEAYRFENNSNKLFYEKFNITELLTNCFESLKTKAQEKEVTFLYDLKSSNTDIEADKEEIRRVILNLLTNAINYCSRGDTLRVTVSESNGIIEFSLNGREFATNIENGGNFSTVGQSIGMYLCRKIIEIHRGKLFVSKDGENNKSVVFSIPKTKLSLQ